MSSFENTMNNFAGWIEKKIVPIAGKIASFKPLIAIRDGFISIVPITLAGATAVLLNNVLFAPTSILGTYLGKTAFYANSIQPFFSNWLQPLMSNIWWGTLAVIALFISFTVPYNVAKIKGHDGIFAGVVGMGAYFAAMPQNAPEAGWGTIHWGYTNSGSIFTALLIGLVSGYMYTFLIEKKITIKLPEQVPPAILKAFTAAIPGFITISFWGLVAIIFSKLSTSGVLAQGNVFDFIAHNVQSKISGSADSLWLVILVPLLNSLFWFMGIHGGNVLDPVMSTVFGPLGTFNTLILQNVGSVLSTDKVTAIMDAAKAAGANVANVTAALADSIITKSEATGMLFKFTGGFFNDYVYLGGGGATLALIIAIYLFSKRADHKAVAQFSLPSGLFEINEPIMFGMPIVLNPYFFLPYVFIPPVLALIAYLPISTGLVPPSNGLVPWTMPPVLSALLNTGMVGNWYLAPILALINLAVATLLYIPFVIATNKQGVVSKSK
ncbi:MAG: PTS sugar transporter subunit IIC [Chloroflexi bacterium]|nr:PTS sugar transporter subunit IIC [Chloroflexota bacterium]